VRWQAGQRLLTVGADEPSQVSRPRSTAGSLGYTGLSRGYMNPPNTDFVMERYGKLTDMDRSFDVEYWQRLGPHAIFEAAWQMVVDVHSQKPGGADDLRLRRSVEIFQRQRR
jgi:hypothetical protein